MSNTIQGLALIGGEAVRGHGAAFQAFDPSKNAALGPDFHSVDVAQVAQACELANAAFDAFRATSDHERADFLDLIAAQILAIGDDLIVRAMAESGLPRARLEGERGRTMNQLKLFAELLREGSWQDARIDTALPTRTPPRPDLRLRFIGVGPVAVFGASNFPLAFSVAGGDTAAALAAGCPVVVKGHPAHPGTSELVGRVIQQAVRELQLPDGVFSLLHDAGTALGQALVAHPAIQAVGFTGSRRGGLALLATAQARPQPIPVFAELSAVNPVFLLPGALKSRAAALAQGFADSLTLGVGQFCTNPGLLLALDGPELDAFLAAAGPALQAKPAAPMLTPGIAAAHASGSARLCAQPGVQVQAQGPGALLATAPASAFLDNPALHEEVFGPTALLLRCRDEAELLRVAEALEGQLTASLHAEPEDTALARRLLPVLERKAGRILGRGFPTGVEVCDAMVHGGPWPATTSPQHSSVGSLAIQRFLRPVCYQDLPDWLLPEALQDANPQALWRLVDGRLQTPVLD